MTITITSKGNELHIIPEEGNLQKAVEMLTASIITYSGYAMAKGMDGRKLRQEAIYRLNDEHYCEALIRKTFGDIGKIPEEMKELM